MVASEDPQDNRPCYRAYVMGEDNRIATFRVILADADDAAADQARQLVDGHPVELWDRSRFVAKFPPKVL